MKLTKSKSDKRIENILFSFLLSAFMVCLVTGISTLRAFGLQAIITAPASFLQAWMVSYFESWLIAFPCLLIVSPLVRNIVDRIIK